MTLTDPQWAAMKSSASDEWETPAALFDELHREFAFTLDVCALPHNAKCARFLSPVDDGLHAAWDGVCWMNPPYGRQISRWVAKAYCESLRGVTVVCLLPARTDTRWFHDYCLRGEVRFIKGRLKFGSATENAPFPNMVVVFRNVAPLVTPAIARQLARTAAEGDTR